RWRAETRARYRLTAMSATTAPMTTTKEYQAIRTEAGTTRRRAASMTMATQVAPSRNIWKRLDRFSARACPQAWSSSAGFSAARIPRKAKILAESARNEWAASARMATLAVTSPTVPLAVLSTALPRPETRARDAAGPRTAAHG